MLGPLTLSQIQANLENRLTGDVWDKDVIRAVKSLAKRSKFTKHYSVTDELRNQRRLPKLVQSPKIPTKDLAKLGLDAESMYSGIASEHGDDFDLENEVRIVMCRPPGPVSQAEVRDRIRRRYNRYFSKAEIHSAIKDLVRYGDVQGPTQDGQYTCNCT